MTIIVMMDKLYKIRFFLVDSFYIYPTATQHLLAKANSPLERAVCARARRKELGYVLRLTNREKYIYISRRSGEIFRYHRRRKQFSPPPRVLSAEYIEARLN